MVTITGGSKLEAALKKIAQSASNAATVKIGFMAGSTYSVFPYTSIPLVAALNEFGHGKTPARPYFRNMVAAHSSEWPAGIAASLKENNYDAKKTLRDTGVVIEDLLRDSIIETNAPPLSPITVMLRGMKGNDASLIVTGKTVGQAAARVAAGKTNYGASTKPLIDSGEMLGAVRSEVE